QRPSTMTNIVEQLTARAGLLKTASSGPISAQQVAPTLAPDTATAPPGVGAAMPTPVPLTPTPVPPTTSVPPAVAALDRSANVTSHASERKRSMTPLIALSVVAVVGGTIAIIALGGGSSTPA